MSVTDHRAASVVGVSCHVLTVSDTRTEQSDRSGPAIRDLLERAGHLIVGHSLLPDDPVRVRAQVVELLDRGQTQAIISTGGTGVSRRDSTYEALAGLIDKELVGFGELFRMLSFQEIGSAAMLSRATAGIARGQALFLLPGSQQAVQLAMTRLILPELGHIVAELNK
ncbi:MAG: MogA/MoaB family molybdenum cofactor biosynthesis protein [Vicinamibacterales bacterium]